MGDTFIIPSEPFIYRGANTYLIGPFLDTKSAYEWITSDKCYLPDGIGACITVPDTP